MDKPRKSRLIRRATGAHWTNPLDAPRKNCTRKRHQILPSGRAPAGYSRVHFGSEFGCGAGNTAARTPKPFSRGRKMDLASINSQIAHAVSNAKAVAATTAGANASGTDFAASLDSALKAVSRSQMQAEELQKQFQLENPNVSLEQTMIAMNTSAINFAAAVQVRNRLTQAYDQIMNMAV